VRITLIVVGKTNFKYVEEGSNIFIERIKRYIPFDLVVLKDQKKGKTFSTELLKKIEGDEILSKLQLTDYVILLDETGKQFTSVEMASMLENKMNSTVKRLVFIIGGAYGFSTDIYNRCNEKISLSRMTFSHQLVRVIFFEQLYRSFTIIKGEPYHHQ
jgi:23S rRNA (pseudouridine1915-N3)-methyltransferase